MDKKALIYEGKSKKLFSTDNANKVIVYFKDEATAFNGLKKATIDGKGIISNKISTLIYRHLIAHGIQTHYIETLNDREQYCEQVTIIPIEVIVRNIAAGSVSANLGIEEGVRFSEPIFEMCYKNDDLNDPLINEGHALALGIATHQTIDAIMALAKKVNHELIALFDGCGVDLVDFKLEFGFNDTGDLVLADEISPDNCRLWDKKTRQKLDKDCFRRDLGPIEEAYTEILTRLQKVVKA